MSSSRFLTVLLLVVMALAALSGPVAAQGPQPAAPDAPFSAAFSYQGSLRSGGAPANGAFDFQCILYNAASGGSQVGSTLTLEDVAVSNGIFTVELDFGAAAFDGQARWLEVGVRPGASTGIYSILSPRHPLTAVPQALYATKAPWSGLQSVPAGFADGVDNDVLGGLSCTNGQVAKWNGAVWNCAADWSLSGNAGTTPGTNFLGTTDNQALELKVNGQRALRIEPVVDPNGGFSPNVIDGSSANEVSAGIYGATIAGGGSPHLACPVPSGPCWNRVQTNFGTVGGGIANTASGVYTTVGGGALNLAAADMATVGGLSQHGQRRCSYRRRRRGQHRQW